MAVSCWYSAWSLFAADARRDPDDFGDKGLAASVTSSTRPIGAVLAVRTLAQPKTFLRRERVVGCHVERTSSPGTHRSGANWEYDDVWVLANRLALEPPNTIRRIIEALEDLMEEDVAAGRPILAAICVSKAWTGIPQPGFFLTAQALGVFSGDPTGPEAFAFHARELQRVLSLYGRP